MDTQQKNNDKASLEVYANLTSISHLHHEVCALYNQTGSFAGAARLLCERHPELNLQPNYCRSLVQIECSTGIIDADLVAENVKAKKQAARQQALNRVERKSFRDYAKIENAVVEILNEISETLSNFGKEFSTPSIISNAKSEGSPTMILHITDAHLNSNINIPGNVFNYSVAASRLFAYVKRAKQIGRSYGVGKVVLCLGGDNLKNLNRPDEMLSVASNRAKGVVLAVHLFRQVILDLANEFTVDIFSVAGNESRISIGKVPDISWDESGATENFDSLIHWSLEHLLGEMKGITFHPHHGNECIFTVNEKNVLLIHGHQLNLSNQRAVQSFTGKFASQGISIDLIMAGHIHNTHISDGIARGSSLCGTDSYASEALGLAGGAAQNIHIINSTGIDSLKIDLQNTPVDEGYSIFEKMRDLYVESESKIRPNYHVHIV